jgi:hypothetical protein
MCIGTISRLSSCLYEEMHGARKSGTGQSLFTEHGCASSGNQAKRGRVLFVCGKKTGQGRQKHVRPLIWPPQDAGPPSLTLHAYAFHGLCRSSVVMVYPTQHRNGNHLVRMIGERGRKRWRVRDLLPEPLMRSSLIERQDRGPEEAGELLLMEDQEVIQACSPHASQKALVIWHWLMAYGMAFEAP